MRPLNISAFFKLTLEKFLKSKLLPKIEYQPIPDNLFFIVSLAIESIKTLAILQISLNITTFQGPLKV